MNLPDRAVLEKLLRGQLAPEVAEQLCRQLENEQAFARVAGLLGVNPTTVLRWISSGIRGERLRAARVGGRWRRGSGSERCWEGELDGAP